MKNETLGGNQAALCSHAKERFLETAPLFFHAEDKDEVSAINRHLLGASEEITT